MDPRANVPPDPPKAANARSDQNLKQFLQRAKTKLHYSILFLEQQLRAGNQAAAANQFLPPLQATVQTPS